uniref:DUF7483 domain-containing protein n=1 Tax=uncultured organism MedDCM-OCT-S11-C359 TaxID=743661 RepID=D6PLH4_9ZZZZ|nr:hypothetical protein [uncultured organism MedDCM-OCT-S11-C359]
MAYTTINKSTDYFNTKLYTGNGSTNAITGVGFQPDMCWWKMRSGTEDHALGDAVRTAGYIVKPNSTDAQAQSASYFASFDSDGFTLGSDTKQMAMVQHTLLGTGKLVVVKVHQIQMVL